MNKRKVKQMIPKAVAALNDPQCDIQSSQNGTFTGKIQSTFRAHLSSFGASVLTGSFKAAVVFYSEPGNSDVDRPQILRILYYISYGKWRPVQEIVREVLRPDADLHAMKDDFLHASIAAKQACNLFCLV